MRKLINEFILFLRVLAMPSCWIRNEPYNRVYDKHLRQALNTHNFIRLSPYYVEIDGMVMWVSNHPYASFAVRMFGKEEIMPSRRTVILAADKLVSDTLRIKETQ